MAITVYRSDDVGAPVLTGEALKIPALLKACLVNGYGSKPAAGWGIAYEDAPAGLLALRAAAGNRFYLRFDDSIVQYPIVRAYEEMTAINEYGVNPFPTTAQLAAGIRPVKSSTTTNIARPWVLVAGTRAFYFWCAFAATDINTPTTSTDFWFFGEFVSYLPGDAFNTALIGKATADTTASNTVLGTNLSSAGADCTGHFMARNYLQTGGSSTCGTLQSIPSGSVHMGAAGAPYPDPISGGMLLDRVRICEGGATAKLVRGHLPGLFNPLHPLPGNHLDTFAGRGALAGKDFLLLYKGGTSGRIVISLDEADWLTPT